MDLFKKKRKKKTKIGVENSMDEPSSDRLNSGPTSSVLVLNYESINLLSDIEEDLTKVDEIINCLLEYHIKSLRKKNVQLKEADIYKLCSISIRIFMSQPNLLELVPPLNIVGDLHGQYNDLLKWFDLVGYPPKANYLFLGDYVDRGNQSIETICLLMAFKIKYPFNFFMLRGNHECASLNLVYGFYNECVKRYNKKIWKAFIDVFNCLPIAAVIEGNIFCCHGGISPSLNNLKEIIDIERPVDVPDEGIICDLLWADPDPYINGYEHSERGVSYNFGIEALSTFLKKHNLDLICRAHQVVEDGYELLFNRQVVTIFSAPNYCGEFDNAGAIMVVDEDLTCSFKVMKPQIENKNRSFASLFNWTK